jgi:hypothetical protein
MEGGTSQQPNKLCSAGGHKEGKYRGKADAVVGFTCTYGRRKTEAETETVSILVDVIHCVRFKPVHSLSFSSDL